VEKTAARPTRDGVGLSVDWLPLAAFDDDDLVRWRELGRRAIESNVFLEPAFARAAVVHLRGNNVGALVVRAGSRLVGLLPGRVESLSAGRPVATFVAWTHPFAPLSAPLIEHESAEVVAAAMIEALPALPGSPRVALFPLIGEQGAVAGLIADRLARTGQTLCRLDSHQRAILVPSAGEPLAAVSAKKLKEMRRQRRRLAERGTLAHTAITGASGIGAAISDYLALEAGGWKGRSGGAAAMRSASSRFLTEAVTGLAAEGKARIDLLMLDRKAVAATITLFSGGRAWFWKTAYDEAFARFSPGVQLALDLSETLGRDRSIALVDSCAVADHPMIDHLWGGKMDVADWLIPLGSRGSFMAELAAERLRRALIAPLKSLRDRLLD
jgi:CelD/BcsL family acetyltransferase involved in cellulose biosynthesis